MTHSMHVGKTPIYIKSSNYIYALPCIFFFITHLFSPCFYVFSVFRVRICHLFQLIKDSHLFVGSHNILLRAHKKLYSKWHPFQNETLMVCQEVNNLCISAVKSWMTCTYSVDCKTTHPYPATLQLMVTALKLRLQFLKRFQICHILTLH